MAIRRCNTRAVSPKRRMLTAALWAVYPDMPQLPQLQRNDTCGREDRHPQREQVRSYFEGRQPSKTYQPTLPCSPTAVVFSPGFGPVPTDSVLRSPGPPFLVLQPQIKDR